MLLNQIVPDTAEVPAGASDGDDFISHPKAHGHILSFSIFLTSSSDEVSWKKILSILGSNVYIPNW